MNFEVSRETHDKLSCYVNELQKWNSKINLVAESTIEKIWERHILDCCQLIKFLPTDTTDILDMGSGAGLPGLVLGITTKHKLTLVESDLKKAAFLKHCSGMLNLNLTIISDRIENLRNKKFHIITARALAPVDRLLSYASPLLTKTGYCLFLKGKGGENEVEEAAKTWHFKSEVFSSATDINGKIVKISEVYKYD